MLLAASREKAIITRGLESFSSLSCIRFRPSQGNDREWLQIESQNGCENNNVVEFETKAFLTPQCPLTEL